MPSKNKQPRTPTIFTKAKDKTVTLGTKDDPVELLAYRNTLQTVAQMRKAQKDYFKNQTKDNLIEAKKLEQAVDMRLATFEIRAVEP